MRAHSQRRLIWTVNVVLGLGVIALLAWIFLDVKPAAADPAYLKPKWAVQAVENFKNTPPTNRSALKPPVSQTEVEEVDRREFRAGNGDRFHWLYSGPMPPAPPEPDEVEEVMAPVEDDLEKLGRVAMLIYICAGEGQDTACETVVYWEFGEGDRVAFSPGEFIRPKGDRGKGGIKLVDVKPADGGDRLYDLHYEVYVKEDQPPTKTGVYRYDGNKDLPPELAARIKERRPAASDAAGGAQPTEAGGRTSGGVTEPAAPAPVPAPPDAGRINPTVKYDNQNRASVTFDQGTYDYFRKTDPDKIAKTVKTQVARDSQGKVIGLQITGISKETPADRFDVKPGDILVSIDGQPVKSRSDAMNIVQGLDANTKLVKVVIDRRGRLITFNIDPTDPKTRRAARALDNR